MANFKDVRATIRDVDSPRPSAGSSAHIYLGLIAFLGFAIGAGAVLFVPRLSAVTPSPSLPTFESVREDIREGESSREPAMPPRPATLDYKADPEQLAKAADSACFQRAHARQPSFSKTPRLTTKELSDFDLKELPHFNELMHCLLTESPVRYCSATQRRMITAEIVTYFHGIDYLNKALEQARKMQAQHRAATGLEDKITIPNAEPDVRVVAAIESRVRDGLLTREDFDQMKTKLPAPLRERLARMQRTESKCPAPAWWAFWR
jgi:hypothetical protein